MLSSPIPNEELAASRYYVGSLATITISNTIPITIGRILSNTVKNYAPVGRESANMRCKSCRRTRGSMRVEWIGVEE